MAAARWSANPQSNNIQLNFCKFAGLAEMLDRYYGNSRCYVIVLTAPEIKGQFLWKSLQTKYLSRALFRLLTLCISISYFIATVYKYIVENVLYLCVKISPC